MKQLNTCILLSLLMLGIYGCGGEASDAPSVASVSGKVMVDGKPQGGLTVEFHPDSTAGTTGPMSTGLTADDGTFILSTSTGRAGAVIGNHKVLVKCPWSLTGRASNGPAPVTADGFGSDASGKAPAAPPASQSDCTVNIRFEDSGTTPLKAVVPADGVSDLLLQATSE
jgi:hypothetical protein